MARVDNLTIVFVDIVGFTTKTSAQSREQNQAMLRDFHRTARTLVAGFGGRTVKSLGDAVLVTFRSPTDAVRCGMALHDAFAERNVGRPAEEEIDIRVAINVGEVRVDRKDIFGEAVNVASRVEGLTPAGEIWITEAVYLAMNKAEVPAKPVGERALKGIPDPVKLWRVPPRHVPRLMTPAETLPPGTTPEPPFGGLHRTLSPPGLLRRLQTDLVTLRDSKDWRSRWREWRGPFAVVLLAVALGVGGSWGWRALERQSASEPGSMTRADGSPNHDAARSRMLAGHVAFLKGERNEAVQAYDEAMDASPALAEDPELAANLVACLSWASEQALPVIREHRSGAILKALSARTAEPGLRGARRAARLLEEFGEAARIDRGGLAITELNELPTCEARHGAVKTLARLRDPRAVAPLEEAISGVGNWFKNGCLYDDARAAIDDLRKRKG